MLCDAAGGLGNGGRLTRETNCAAIRQKFGEGRGGARGGEGNRFEKRFPSPPRNKLLPLRQQGDAVKLERSGFFNGLKGFDDVADLDVVEVFEADAAFVALDHFAGVVLEALEGADLAGVDHHAVAQ